MEKKRNGYRKSFLSRVVIKLVLVDQHLDHIRIGQNDVKPRHEVLAMARNEQHTQVRTRKEDSFLFQLRAKPLKGPYQLMISCVCKNDSFTYICPGTGVLWTSGNANDRNPATGEDARRLESRQAIQTNNDCVRLLIVLTI
jgi:hypothetical protein